MNNLHFPTKIIFAAMLFASCIKMNAQDDRIYQPTNIMKYHHDNAFGEKNTNYKFEYDGKGRLTKFIEYEIEDGREESYFIDLKYDEYNLPVEKTVTFSDPGPYSCIKYCFYYDVNNNNRIDSILGYGKTGNNTSCLCFSLRNYYEDDKIISQKFNSTLSTFEYPTENQFVILQDDSKGIYNYYSDHSSYFLYKWLDYDYFATNGVYFQKNINGQLAHISNWEYKYYISDLEMVSRQKFSYNGNNLILILGDANMDDTIPYDDNRVEYNYDDLNRLQSIICIDNNYNNPEQDKKNLPFIHNVFSDQNLKTVDDILTSHIANSHFINVNMPENYFGVFDSLFVTSYVETPIPHYGIYDNGIYDSILDEAEWYYEITDDEGNITYQYLQSSGDTVVGGERPHIVVRTNTLYDKSKHVTHEYVYNENDTLYWWNKNLGKFTILYDFNAIAGDSWVIETENGEITMKVDAVENYIYDGKTYKMLVVNDENDIFSGKIVCGIGHLKSFFPEKLMTKDKDIRIDGMRCYWQHNLLVFKYSNEDCDAKYETIHFSVSENNENSINVYPNPGKNELVVITENFDEYDLIIKIFDINGRKVFEKTTSSETETINTTDFNSGIYLIKVGNKNIKWLKY